jgi:hypothetical protein
MVATRASHDLEPSVGNSKALIEALNAAREKQLLARHSIN